jgi:hypothetical protein
MPALNFHSRFVPLIEAGTKNQTIRAPRRDGRPHCLRGDELKLYTGMRTKACRLVKIVTVTWIEGVVIYSNGMDWMSRSSWLCSSHGDFLRAFAIMDGFEGWCEMRDWFDKRHGLPFQGNLISW